MYVRTAVLLLTASLLLSTPARASDAVYASVSRVLKAAAATTQTQDELRRAYVGLRIMDRQGRFTVAALGGHKALLAPVDASAFVDRVVSCAVKNPYLNAVMASLAKSGYQLQRPGQDADLARVVGYAVALDRLTKVMRGDHRVLRALRAHWRQYKKGMRHLATLNLFEKAKFLTIEYRMGTFLKSFETGKLPGDTGRVTLPLNIIEAVLEDLRLGNADNARAGLTLAFARPGDKTLNKRTGAGPTIFSADREGILYQLPLTRNWVDLYGVWNLAFVSHYPEFPAFMAKLLTPQVLCNEGQPTEYIYNRGLALYLHLHYSVFRRHDREAARVAKKPLPAELSWADDNLTKAFAKQNLESAKDYDRALNKADPSFARTLRLEVTAGLSKFTALGKAAIQKLRTKIGEPFVEKAKELGQAVSKTATKALTKTKQGAKKALDGLRSLFKR